MAGMISSRMPGGLPGKCPVCEAVVWIEPSDPAGDAPCPSCGTLLWFVQTSDGLAFYQSEAAKPVLDRLLAALAERGIDVESLRSGDVDSLDLVELMMQLDECTGMRIPPEEAEQMQSIGDVIRYLLDRLL